MRAILFALLSAFLLGGCVGAVKSVVTAPVKAVGQVADWSTTSQDEADRNRGRAMREREERLGKLSRQHDKAAENAATATTNNVGGPKCSNRKSKRRWRSRSDRTDVGRSS